LFVFHFATCLPVGWFRMSNDEVFFNTSAFIIHHWILDILLLSISCLLTTNVQCQMMNVESRSCFFHFETCLPVGWFDIGHSTFDILFFILRQSIVNIRLFHYPVFTVSRSPVFMGPICLRMIRMTMVNGTDKSIPIIPQIHPHT